MVEMTELEDLCSQTVNLLPAPFVHNLTAVEL